MKIIFTNKIFYDKFRHILIENISNYLVNYNIILEFMTNN